MTAMVYLDTKPDMAKTIIFQDEDFDGEGKTVFNVGETMTAENVFTSMLVGSVNASARAIARTSLGTKQFVEAMNTKARELGLRSPVFVESSGIDPQNRASAADIAAIITYASGYAQIRDATGVSGFIIKKGLTNEEHVIKSTNLLLGTYLNKDPYHIVAAKTGSLAEAGYCMAQVTRNAAGHQIVAVELGSNNHFSRYQDIKALTTWAFETYEW
jgi:D-alanyl-D-alanine endopeptidase (penicillin-binding protein 7)